MIFYGVYNNTKNGKAPTEAINNKISRFPKFLIEMSAFTCIWVIHKNDLPHEFPFKNYDNVSVSEKYEN